MRTRNTVFAALLASASLASLAQDVGQHPAIFAARQLPGVDPSTFIVGHPASPTWHVEHANGEHPAVLVSRAWANRQVNANTFIVQPPTQVAWTNSGAADAAPLSTRLRIDVAVARLSNQMP